MNDPSAMWHPIVKESELGIRPVFALSAEHIPEFSKVLYNETDQTVIRYDLGRVDKHHFHMGFARFMIPLGQQGLVDLMFDYEED